MADAPSSREQVLLDACCLLNLHATGHIAAILEALAPDFVVASAVAAEAGYLCGTSELVNADVREPVSHEPLVSAGLLKVWDIASDEEYATYFAFSRTLDDGEAVTCALAVHRGAVVATDDRAALRLLATHAPAMGIYTTTRLLSDWVHVSGIGGPELRTVLRSVQMRSRYVPPRTDPLYPWWEASVRD